MTTIIDGIVFFFAGLVNLLTENETASEDFALSWIGGINPLETQKKIV